MREMEVADWVSLSDAELLERRISTLGLQLEGTALEPLIRQLNDELSAHGLVFHPPCHVGDEWFVPIGIPAIFIPFFWFTSGCELGTDDDAGSRREERRNGS